MSRIGRLPVPIPKGVEVKQDAAEIRVKGPKGSALAAMPSGVTVEVGSDEIVLSRRDEAKSTRAAHGLARALVANLVTGVTEGFNKELEIQGVGYRAEAAGKVLKLSLGFSHPVDYPVPEGLSVSVQENKIRIEGVSKELVGQFAADVRSLRPPEPYKGKGIRYVGEQVRRKVGKAGAA